MKFNKKNAVFIVMLLVVIGGIYTTRQSSTKTTNSTTLTSDFNPQCLKNANTLVGRQQKTADKESAMTTMPDMQGMEMEHVTVTLDKSVYNQKLNMCIVQIHIVINKNNNTLNEEQIFAVYNNESKDKILAQYSPSLNDKTNFIASSQANKFKTNINKSDLVSFAQGIGLN